MTRSKYHLGSWSKGSLVQLGIHRPNPSGGTTMPGEWVTVVGNYASTTGVVVVRSELTGSIYERDGHTQLFQVDPLRATRE